MAYRTENTANHGHNTTIITPHRPMKGKTATEVARLMHQAKTVADEVTAILNQAIAHNEARIQELEMD